MHRYAGLILGKLAIARGLVTRDQITATIRLQDARRDDEESDDALLGELLVEQGFLSPEQLTELLALQTTELMEEEDLLLGELAVRNGFVDQPTLDETLGVQRGLLAGSGEMVRLGEILLASDILEQQHLFSLLKAQQRMLRERREAEYEDLRAAATEGPADEAEVAPAAREADGDPPVDP